jgi:hypothetical protein
MAACIKKAVWLACNANLSPMTEQHFLKNYFSLTDEQFLAQLDKDLRTSGYEAAAELLLGKPFLSGRRALFRRVWVASEARNHQPRQYGSMVLEGVYKATFKTIAEYEDFVCDRLKLDKYSILIDRLPLGKSTPDWPPVVDNSGTALSRSMGPVSEAISQTMGKSRKVRVFVSQDQVEKVKDFGFDELTQVLSDAVSEVTA